MHSLKRGTLAAILATAAATSGIALAAPPRRLPFPQCQPRCKGGPARGPRVTAIFVHAQNGARPALVVDAYLAGFGRSPYGSLCYEHTPPPAWVPGCSPIQSARGRPARNHRWHLHFNVPVYTRGYLQGRASDVLLRRYWVAVAAGATPSYSPAWGARKGEFQPFAGHRSAP